MNTIRSPGMLWKVLRFPLTRIIIAFGAIVLVAFPILIVAKTAKLHGFAYAIAHLCSALVAVAIYLAYVRWLERRIATELAPAAALPGFSKGFGVGALLSCMTVGVLRLAGAYQPLGINPANTMAAALIASVGAALLEEIAVRGVLFRIMEEGLGTWLALALSALIFGLLHAVNPGAGWRDILGIALQGGLLLAATYVYARQLWICIGLHCAWNFGDGGVFGASGQPHSLFRALIRGPDWMTGGTAGLDGSLIALLFCLAATAAFLLLAQRRGHIMAAPWNKP